ncbi:hypothetical protein, partial [Shewanella denitrificans]|uniref:hypothetical protein n=1 Tax=Shewanella denitrificans TaxID=192073 RepID=UPI0039EE746C
QGGKINSNPSPLELPPCRPDEVVEPHIHLKIPNGSTAHPGAQRALTIIPDGCTVFLGESIGNFEGSLCTL